MPKERSAGAIIFRKEKEGLKFLILQYIPKHWDFPRGHVEAGESDIDTAKREIREETGLKNLKFIPGFSAVNSWSYKRDGKIFDKDAIFFLAQSDVMEVNLSAEHLDHKWMDIEGIKKTLTFDNAKKVFAKAIDFLNKTN